MAIPNHDTPVPVFTFEDIKHYVLDGDRPGGFLYAFLTEDFEGTMKQADMSNARHLVNIFEILYNMAPAPSWGDTTKVENWIAGDGIESFERERWEKIFREYREQHYNREEA